MESFRDRTERRRPIKVFSLPNYKTGIRIACWKGQKAYSFTIIKQIRQPDGTYKNTYVFFLEDLLVLAFLIKEVVSWLCQQAVYKRMPDQMYDDEPGMIEGMYDPLVGRNGDDAKLLSRYEKDDDEE